MKKLYLLFLFLSLFVLSGCGSKATIEDDVQPMYQKLAKKWRVHLLTENIVSSEEDGTLEFKMNGKMVRQGGKDNYHSLARYQIIKKDEAYRLYFGDSNTQVENQINDNGILYYDIIETKNGFQLIMSGDSRTGFDLSK